MFVFNMIMDFIQKNLEHVWFLSWWCSGSCIEFIHDIMINMLSIDFRIYVGFVWMIRWLVLLVWYLWNIMRIRNRGDYRKNFLTLGSFLWSMFLSCSIHALLDNFDQSCWFDFGLIWETIWWSYLLMMCVGSKNLMLGGWLIIGNMQKERAWKGRPPFPIMFIYERSRSTMISGKKMSTESIFLWMVWLEIRGHK